MQRLGQHGPLAHPARHLMRITVLETAQPHSFQPFASLLLRLRAWHVGEFQPGRHVGQGAAPGHERLALEHIAGAVVHALQRFPEDFHLAQRRGQQARPYIEQGGLAAAGGPDHRNEFARSDGDRGFLDRCVALLAALVGGEGASDIVEQ